MTSPRERTRAGLLYVGTFPSLRATTRNRAYCEDLSDRLESTYSITRTSPHLRRIPRLADVLYTTYARRGDYELALVDVFSGLAFTLVEAVTFELRRLRKPHVLTLHGGLLPEFAARWPRRVRAVLDSAVLVTAPSRYLAERMRPFCDRIVVIPNAVDIAAFPHRLRARPAPRLVWVRAFHDIYNPTLAIDTLVRLVDRFPDVMLTMVGPDKDGSLATTRARAEATGVIHRVRFVGGVPHDEVARYLSEADVFINTTNVDNTPLSVLEAAACGLCMVSTSVGGIPFLLDDGRDALLVPPGDATAMSAAVTRVLSEAGLAERLSGEGRKLAVEHDWSTVIEQWQRALDGVGIPR